MLIYQIYPRSFADGSGDGIGDLAGIAARLDHIASLSVDAVWIGPVFASPMDDFGYDVSDYRAIDPVFGTLADFDALVAAARDRGIGVLVDMVVSHTSDRHRWFADSRARRNGRDDWYLWADAQADGSPPNNWMSVFGGPAWRWDAERRQYHYHAFLASQPDLNFHHPAVQQQVLDEMAWWLDRGVAGFRLDACNHYFQDAALRSNPPLADTSRALHPYQFQQHLYDKNRPEVPAFLARVRELLDRHGAYAVAEVGGSDSAEQAAAYVAPGRLHAAYNFDLLKTDRSAGFVAEVLRAQAALPPGAGQPCHALSNHDKPRVVTRWGGGRDERVVARQVLALLACLNGSVCIYQGDELGLPQADVPYERLRDPYGRRFWPRFAGRDGCRTPMPWHDGAYAGFSTVEPWLPVDPRHAALNVAAQERDVESTLAFARRAFALRRARAELHAGTLDAVAAVGDVLVFERRARGRALRCAFHLGDAPAALRWPDAASPLLQAGVHVDGGDLRLDVGGFYVAPVTGGG